MNATPKKPVRSPSYPNMSLTEAVEAIRKIETVYRSSAVDRQDAAKLIGYSSLSGPANSALAALAAYGLLERAGKGEARVTERAKAILYAENDEERASNLRDAAIEPPLFRELRERFPDIDVPPEDGVVTFLNRSGFNPNAIRPAAKAFLRTMEGLKEIGATESHGVEEDDNEESGASDGDDAATYGGAQVGDLVQWESHGVLRFSVPLRVRHVTDDGEWVAVEGSETGIPMNEVIVKERASDVVKAPPIFPMQSVEIDASDTSTDLRFKVGREIVVRVSSPVELGVSELDKLLKLIEAQRDALKD